MINYWLTPFLAGMIYFIPFSFAEYQMMDQTMGQAHIQNGDTNRISIGNQPNYPIKDSTERMTGALAKNQTLNSSEEQRDSSRKQTISIVILGDSLTDGYGIEKEKAFPSLLEKALNDLGYNIKIVNAGISGSTSSSAPSRLRWLVKQKPNVLFLALGSNDGLRGVDSAETKKNLLNTIQIAEQNNVLVWLAGMKIPPNYGLEYTRQFEALFADLAKEKKIPFFPFLLEGVAAKPELNQADKIHPNEKGHALIAKNLLPFFQKNLKSISLNEKKEGI